MHTYSKELRIPTHPSRMALVIYRFELLVAYTESKLYVRSPHRYVHLNPDTLVLRANSPRRRKLWISNDD